ncbi:uncharacterized protein C12orf71 homolog [Tenrec ecaudatus]|uniref:uncharacterized protein C12orf71 homolog n=1 Tax=Tenrec ecaudatus TaxID=94439 RepID=UPI003F590768
MAHSSSNSNSTDPEDCSSVSDLSVSVGYFPSDDTFYENTIPQEDRPSTSPKVHFHPPIQGMWGTTRTLRVVGRRDWIQGDPEQFCKLSIALAWDADVASSKSDSTMNWNLKTDNGHMDKGSELTLGKLDSLVQKLERFIETQEDEEDSVSVFHESTQKEDLQLPSSSSLETAQVSDQNHRPGQDLPNFRPLENEDVTQFPPSRRKLQEHELMEINHTTGSRKSWAIETSSNSSGQAEESSLSSTQAPSCLNFGWIFRWLRQQVFSSLPRRQHPERTTKSPGRVTRKQRFSLRNNKIHPQEALDLGNESPYFLTF